MHVPRVSRQLLERLAEVRTSAVNGIHRTPVHSGEAVEIHAGCAIVSPTFDLLNPGGRYTRARIRSTIF